jgi:hypothetical protein
MTFITSAHMLTAGEMLGMDYTAGMCIAWALTLAPLLVFIKR